MRSPVPFPCALGFTIGYERIYDLACSYLHNLSLTTVHLPHCILHVSCVLLNVLPMRSCVAYHALA